MFDRYLIEEETLRNVQDGGQVVGWSIDARIGYYRGLGLSMVDVDLFVDGAAVPRERIHLRLHGKDYRLDALGDVLDDRWGFGESVTLFVEQPGGLSDESEHEIQLVQSLRISYLAVPSVNRDAKVLRVA